MYKKITSRYKEIRCKEIWNSLKHHEWTSPLVFLTILFGLLVAANIVIFQVYSDKVGNDKTWWLTFALLSCIVTISITTLIGVKISMPYFLRKREDDIIKENKILSIIQEEYEHKRLEEKTRIGIIEKHAKAIIEEMTREAESHRQLESKNLDYNIKIAEIINELYKSYCSVQNPQTLSDQQIVSQLIQLLTNNNS